MRKSALIILCLLVLISPSRAQWQPTNGPAGGYIRHFKFDGSCVYAANNSGVLVSEDDGQSWSFRNTGLISCDTKSLAGIGNWLFVSTDENVFRTTDQGMNWEK